MKKRNQTKRNKNNNKYIIINICMKLLNRYKNNKYMNLKTNKKMLTLNRLENHRKDISTLNKRNSKSKKYNNVN